jgi:hypothetical protein
LVSAYELPNAAETMKLVADCRREEKSLRSREESASAEAEARAQIAREQEYALRRPYDAKRVERIKKSLLTAEETVASLREDLARARIKSPEEREKKLKEAETAFAAAREANQAAEAPFREEERAFRAEQEPLSKAIQAFGESFTRVPEELQVEKRDVRGVPSAGMAVIGWFGKNREQIAHVQLQLGDKGAQPLDGKRLFAGKYPIISLRGGSVRLIAGDVQVALFSPRPEWQENEQILEVVAKLVDLDGLAALPKAPADNPSQKTIEQAVEGRRQASERSSRRMAATEETRQALYAAMGRRQEWSEPYNPEQVEKLEQGIAQQEKQIARNRALLETESIEPPEARAAQCKKAQTECEQAENDVLAAKAPFRADRVVLARKQRLAEFALWDLTSTSMRTPEELGIVEANLSNLSVRNGQVEVQWRDAMRRVLISGELLLTHTDQSNSPGKLVDKYPILKKNDEQLQAVVGNVSLRLTVHKAEWQGRDKIEKMAAKLVDLEAIAAWPPLEDGR